MNGAEKFGVVLMFYAASFLVLSQPATTPLFACIVWALAGGFGVAFFVGGGWVKK